MLADFLVSQLFGFLLIFFRMGAGIMLLPGFGEFYLPSRVRLLFALFLSMLLLPMVQPLLPPLPTQPLSLAIVLVGEILIGLLIGTIARILINGVHVAGTIIATQSSLASAMMLDFTQAGQATAVTNFLSFTALCIIFALNLHHLMLQALVDSYTLFTPGIYPPMEDFANFASRAVTSSFAMALQISAPHIVIGLVMYLGAGVLNRMMPSMQVFFIIMAPQIMISFFVLAVALSAMMLWYMRYIEEGLKPFLAP